MTDRSDYKSKTPYQDKTPEHPSMLEIQIPKPFVNPTTEDPYSGIDSYICDFSDVDSEHNCIIAKDEECIGCKTCIRLGF